MYKLEELHQRRNTIRLLVLRRTVRMHLLNSTEVSKVRQLHSQRSIALTVRIQA